MVRLSGVAAVLASCCWALSAFGAPADSAGPEQKRRAAAVEKAAAANVPCVECHSAKGARARAPLPGTKAKAPLVNMQKHGQSVHGQERCVDCHVDAKPALHEPKLGPVDCGGCHAKASEQYRLSVHAPQKAGRPAAATCADCHGTHETLPAKNRDSTVHPRRIPELCGDCHTKIAPSPDHRQAVALGFQHYKDSIHYRAIQKSGLTKAATCVSCHGSHAVRSHLDRLSSVNRWNVPATCGTCHKGPEREYREGVHGQALARRSFDTPVCTDCHGEHGIRERRDPQSRVFAASISKSTCPQCHGATRINEKYGLQAEQRETYKESFHGLADQFGVTTVANCASCHGAHRILHSSDPRSSVNPKNVPESCGKCHENAGANYAVGGVHRPMSAGTREGRIVRNVRLFYLGLIGVTVGLMLAHNALDYAKVVRMQYRRRSDKRRYVRFVRSERWQHAILAISFFALVFTGFALRYPAAFWVKPLMNSELSFLVRGYAHRVSAIVFVVLCVYHAGYLVRTRRGREQWRALLPRKRDLSEVKQQVLYYLGRRPHPGHFDRYSYVEKVEYLALIWGSILMIVTGAILWFEGWALRHIPLWLWSLADVVHLYEAWLATLSIVVWHFYHVIFKTAHVNPAMFAGDLTEEEMRHEHPAELERITSESQAGTHPGEPPKGEG
ncbi:MAG TPA: cytochrome b/b6 domain-containing protein [Polyangiaceae bacterium]